MRSYRRAHAVPRAQLWIDLGVIEVDTRIGAVQWAKERQQMDGTEKSSKWSVRQQPLSSRKSTTRQPIDVGAELDLVLHGRRRRPLSAIYLPTRCFRSRLFS